MSLRRVFTAAAVAAVVLAFGARGDAAESGGAMPNNGGFDDRPVIVLREDDIRSTWRIPYATFGGLSALEYGKLKRIPVTWGIICSVAETGWGLTWAQIKDYLDTAGGEAISHSCTHSPMPDTQGYIDELINSKALIEQRLPGYTCTSFYQPGTWTGEANLNSFSKLDGPIGQALQATYERSMAYLGGGWMVGPVCYDYGLTYSFSLDFWNPSAQQVLTILDIVAATPGLIFIVSCHGVAESGGPSDVKADVMKAFMDRAAELRDSGQIRLMSLRDAYSVPFSPGLNRLADPGFELCNPALLNDWGPWRLFKGTTVVSTGAHEGQRFARIVPGSNTLQKCIVQPGRYRLSWWQKIEAGSPQGKGIHCYVSNSNPDRSAYVVYGVHVPNAGEPESWERHELLLTVQERMPTLSLEFVSYAGATLGIDEVSLVPEPVDPQVSCSGTTVEVHPENVKVSWDTPPGDIDRVQIRWGNRTHPQTLQDGVFLAQTPAVPGTRQEVTVPVNWAQQTPGAFFSVFAISGDNQCAPPDLASVSIDRSAPVTPGVQVRIQPELGVSGSWASNDPESAIEQFRYAVGDSAGDNSVMDWTYTDETTVSLVGLPFGRQLYLSVQAQNVFGYWSSIGSTVFVLSSSIPEVMGCPDGITVGVPGVVTAVFDDCCYIQQPGVPRGIKVRNAPPCAEGDTLSVNGILGTERGERVLVAR